MGGNVLRNIWQLISLLAFFAHQAYSCLYHVYICKCMSTHIHTKEIRSLKQDDKSQIQARHGCSPFTHKTQSLGNLATLQLQNI